MKFDSMLTFLVKACDAMVKINYLAIMNSKIFSPTTIFFPKCFPQMNFFPSLYLGKSSREQGGS
jgi:hypothetical protein